MTSGLQRVLDQLAQYEHPLLRFDARQMGEAVDKFNDANGSVQVTYSAVTSVTVAVYE